MSYIQHESVYRNLVSGFVDKTLAVDQFISLYFAQWREDRDAQWNQVESGHIITSEERKLPQVLEGIFTACYVYSLIPHSAHELNKQQLHDEIVHHAGTLGSWWIEANSVTP